LPLRRGISVLIGGAFEWLFALRGGNLNRAIYKSSNALGVAQGGGGYDVEASI